VWFTVIGFVVEVIGLALTGFGLWQTWESNAEGRDFLPPRLRAAVNWVKHSVLRRPRPGVTVSLNAQLPAWEVALGGHAYASVRDDMTIEEKLNVVHANAISAIEAAARANQAAERERRERERALARFDERFRATEQTLTSFARGLVVDGIPLAVLGLGLAVVGLTLQTVGSLLG
jgi:hypothetical protein